MLKGFVWTLLLPSCVLGYTFSSLKNVGSISLAKNTCLIKSAGETGSSRKSKNAFCKMSILLDIDRTKIGTLDVSTMGMGTLNWPLDKKEDPNAEAALRACISKGVNLFDTAEAYGFGTSEILTRNCVAVVGEPAIVATKFAPVPWRRRPEDVVDACRASAERLGVEAVDLYQIHWPDIIQPLKPFGLEERKVSDTF
jgi:hypothetical protein